MEKRWNWISFGGAGQPMVCAHANGFPIRCYEPLVEAFLPNLQVEGWESRPLVPGTDPGAVTDWRDLADDLMAAIEGRFSEPVIGMGHSLGGVLNLIAASARPDLYRGLILLDPVVFSGFRAWMWGAIKTLGRETSIPLMAGALRRRDHWPDRPSARRGWQDKPLFQGWNDRAFEAYVQSGLAEDPGRGGFTLRYPKAWEARIFGLTPHNLWRDIGRLEIPVLILRGEHSDTLNSGALNRFGRMAAQATWMTVPGSGHLLPMQKPEQVSGLVADWMRTALGVEPNAD